jgi:hypothetical protein
MPNYQIKPTVLTRADQFRCYPTRMIFREFASKLNEVMVGHTWQELDKPDGKIVFPAKCRDFGDIEVFEDNAELIVFFGRFTHMHFSSADEALNFISEVFDDRWEFYRAGGCCRRGGRNLLSKLVFGGKTYVWS